MGLLSKAAAGPQTVSSRAQKAAGTKNRGGLLNIITQKQAERRFEPAHIGQSGTWTETAGSPLERAVMEGLVSGHKQFGVFQGLVLESTGEFSGRLVSITGIVAAAQALAPGRCLLLFDGERDRELIARHLAKTLPGKNLFSFQAETPEEAFTLLKPYL